MWPKQTCLSSIIGPFGERPRAVSRIPRDVEVQQAVDV